MPLSPLSFTAPSLKPGLEATALKPGTEQPDNFMNVLLGEVTRNLQKTSGLFSGSKHQGTASLFHDDLANDLLAQWLAGELAQQLSSSMTRLIQYISCPQFRE